MTYEAKHRLIGVSLAIVGLIMLAVAGRGTGGSFSSLPVGGEGELRLAGADCVWVCLDDSAWDAMIDAENRIAERRQPHPGEAIARLAEAGRIRIIATGSKVRILDRGAVSRKIEIVSGEDRGKVGWVQAEFVYP
jgi:hypothetical protein